MRSSCDHKRNNTSHLHIVDVKVGRRLVEDNKSVEQKLGISSLEEDTQDLAAVADRLVDVEARADRFVPRNLGDDADGRGSVASEVLHGDGLEPDAVRTAGSSDLPNFPGMSEACGVTGLLHPTGDDSILEGSTDVQYKVLASRFVGGEQVRWSSVQTWILSVGACKMDQHVGLT